MNNEEDDIPPEETIIITGSAQIIVPKCCQEGYPDCPHAVRDLRPKKTNIGL